MNKKKNDNTVKVTIKKLRDKKDLHSHVIIESIDDKHVSVGLSTKKRKGKGKKSGKNYALKLDPLGTGKQSYMRRQGTVQRKGAYQDKSSGKMDTDDYNKAKIYGEVAKQKYLRNKNNKKR